MSIADNVLISAFSTLQDEVGTVEVDRISGFDNVKTYTYEDGSTIVVKFIDSGLSVELGKSRSRVAPRCGWCGYTDCVRPNTGECIA